MKLSLLLTSIATLAASLAVAVPHGGTRTAKQCTATVLRLKQFNLSPTLVTYLHTITRTSSVDCDGCENLFVKSIGGIGPVRFVSTTITEPLITTTTLVCSATPTATATPTHY